MTPMADKQTKIPLSDAMLWKKKKKKGKDTGTVWARQQFSKIIILIEKQKYGLKQKNA